MYGHEPAAAQRGRYTTNTIATTITPTNTTTTTTTFFNKQAAMYGHELMVDLLLRSGADATLVDENGWSADRYAKKAGFVSIASKCPEVPYSLMHFEKTRYENHIFTASRMTLNRTLSFSAYSRRSRVQKFSFFCSSFDSFLTKSVLLLI
jgi:hypothetical protein